MFHVVDDEDSMFVRVGGLVTTRTMHGPRDRNRTSPGMGLGCFKHALGPNCIRINDHRQQRFDNPMGLVWVHGGLPRRSGSQSIQKTEAKVLKIVLGLI